MTVDGLRRGDPAVLDDLLARYGQEIQGVAYLILRDPAEAEDVLADTVLRALERGAGLHDATALRSWLLRIATNLALTRRRQRQRVTRLEAVPPASAAPPPSPDRIDLLEDLARLSPRSRAVIVLHYHAGLSVAEVAAALGTSPNTVKTQLRRALERLRIRMVDEPTAHSAPQTEVDRA
jgi:RNA polymerase sigma-70 factor (ECF subfamily)